MATLTLWAFLGMESATIPADAVREPEGTIPRATIAGTLLAAVVYIGSTTAVSGIIPPAELVQSAAPFADAAARIWGPDAAAFVAAVAAISCFGALNGWVLLQGQMPAAVAKDGLFPKVFARLSRRGTPDFAMIISGLFISLLVALNYTKSLAEIFTFVILISTLTVLLPYVFCSLAEIMIRRRQNKELAGLPKAGLLLLSTAGFLYSVWAVGGAGEEVVYWGFLLLLSGIPVYVWTKRS